MHHSESTLVLLALASLSLLGVTAGCAAVPALAESPASDTAIPTDDVGATLRDGLQYFGYPMLDLVPAQVPEMKSHTNAISLSYDPAQADAMRAVLDQLDASFQAVIFVNGHGTYPGLFLDANQRTLPEDQRARNLDGFTAFFAPYRDKIRFFAFDEPYWRAQQRRCADEGTTPDGCARGGLAPDENARVRAELEKDVTQLRAAFPSVGSLVIEAGPMVTASIELPRNVEVFGFDCYTKWDDCWGRSIPTVYDTLRQRVVQLDESIGGHRHLAVVGDTSIAYERRRAIDYDQGLAARDEDEVIASAGRYEALYHDDPMVVLVAAWIWQSIAFSDGTVTRGARSLPKVRQVLEDYGRAVVGKPVVAWSAAPVVEFLVSSAVKVGERSQWIWSTTGASSCRSVSEPDVFPNLPASGTYFAAIETTPRVIDYTIECTGAHGTTRASTTLTVE